MRHIRVSHRWLSKEPRDLAGSVSIEATCQGSRGSGTIYIGAAKGAVDADGTSQRLELSILQLTVGDREVEVVAP